MFFFLFIPYGTLWASWIWVLICFPFVREVFNYNLLKYFLMLFLSLFWDLYNSNTGALNFVPEVFETVFFKFCYGSGISTILYSSSPIWFCLFVCLFVCLHLLFCYWFPLGCCFICYCAFHHCFLFSSSTISLLKFSLSS